MAKTVCRAKRRKKRSFIAPRGFNPRRCFDVTEIPLSERVSPSLLESLIFPGVDQNFVRVESAVHLKKYALAAAIGVVAHQTELRMTDPGDDATTTRFQFTITSRVITLKWQ